MSRQWFRVSVAVVATVATLAVALNTLVIEPTRAIVDGQAAATAAREAQVAARLIRAGLAVPAGVEVSSRRPALERAVGVAPVGDGRFARVALHDNRALFERLWLGLLLVAGTTLMAGAGWVLWAGLVRARELAGARTAVQQLAGGDYSDVATTAHSRAIAGLLDSVDRLRCALESASLEQATTVGIVAHDLRSPLHGIQLAAERLARGSDVAERARAHAVIDRECARVARIADDMLGLSCEAVLAPLEGLPSVPLGRLLRDVADRLCDQRAVVVSVDAELHDLVCDDAQLARSLGNLAENAVRHAPAGSPVRLLARANAIGGVELVVEDDGPGFDPQQACRPFVQGSTARGRAGLGLASVDRAVAAIGGAVRFDRSDAGGTSAVISLPSSVGVDH